MFTNQPLRAALLALAGQAVATPFPSSSASGASPTGAPSSTLQECARSMDGVLPAYTPSTYDFSGTVRRYYVAAEEVEWDYAPTGWDNWLGVPLSLSPRADAAGTNVYGTKWLKALYRGYTDSSFTEQTEQPPWQGTQGPTIRSEVGDLVEIMFVNNLTQNYATMHSMGLAYTKAHGEGADYPNNTHPDVNVYLDPSDRVPPRQDHTGVEPGNCVVYKWMVQPSAGPNNNEPARVHSYHSYVSLQQDTNAGLIGPQIVYAPGKMNSTMANYREFTLLYMIYHESDSWLSAQNAALLNNGSSTSASSGSGANNHCQGTTNGNGNGQVYGPHGNNGYNGNGNCNNEQGNGNAVSVGNYNPLGGSTFNINSTEGLWPHNQTVWHPQLVNLQGAGQWAEAPNFYTMNGYVFSNNPIFNMCEGDNAIWYTNAYGSASHVFHMHGNGFSYQGENRYAISLNDGVGKTLYMPAAMPGLWQVICHVDNHHAQGMVANYNISPQGSCPLPAPGSS